MNIFHKVTCPKCDHSFTFHEVKTKVKENWLKRLIGRTVFIICLLLIFLVILTGIRGMTFDESGVAKGFGSALQDQISFFIKE
jgi:hypothetical protein